MAAPDAANVYVAAPLVTGGILTAAIGTALPATTAAVTTGFDATGYVGEDGLTLTIDRSTEDVMAWGGSKIRVITTSHSVQMSLALLEVTPENLTLMFGTDNVVTVGEETTVKLNGVDLPHFALIVDTSDGDKRVRITAADAQVVEQDDLVFTHSAPTAFQITIECFPDANGDKATILYNTGVVTS